MRYRGTPLSVFLLAFLWWRCVDAFVVRPWPGKQHGWCSCVACNIASTALHFTPPHNIDTSSISFLGRGPEAIVRPGAVLVAPTDEYNHYLMKSALFVYAMGMDEYDEPVIRCVVIDNPTPFTMGEMANLKGHLSENLLYRGGNSGGETAMLLHSVMEIGKEEIGSSGIYEGGLEMAKAGDFVVERFKFFFNYCQFSPNELESMLDEVNPETGDAWVSLQVPAETILHEWDKNDCWKFLRKVVRERFPIEA